MERSEWRDMAMIEGLLLGREWPDAIRPKEVRPPPVSVVCCVEALERVNGNVVTLLAHR